MRISWSQALVVVAGLVGCSPSAFRGHSREQERLDVLTSYTLALSKRDYREAARFLAPEDRAKLADAQQGILPEYRERIRAIRRTTLLNNPLIEVRDGLIRGIPDVLPVLALGSIDTAAQDAGAEIAPLPAPDRLPERIAQEDLHRAAREFFRAVARKDWDKAMGYVDPQERTDFLDAKGEIREPARRRLAAADTSGWEALTLKEGKLTGVFLILPEGIAARSGDRPAERSN